MSIRKPIWMEEEHFEILMDLVTFCPSQETMDNVFEAMSDHLIISGEMTMLETHFICAIGDLNHRIGKLQKTIGNLQYMLGIYKLEGK